MRSVKEPGAAHDGFSDWYWQRLSAVVLLLLLPLPFFLLVSVYSGSLDQQGLLDIIDHIYSRVLHTILILALIVHAYVGLKVILEDYVHRIFWRVPLIGTMLVMMAGFGIWWLALIWAWA
ncbi:succinate dehydrogenase subunit D [Mariprofundus aestuarium]|uniref:Succinate dehydrogenase hydrophobic membrane anchor subunit n=1 Tax=Mariprofundus aestuarium TaxID=1921086 RepID=A0A2K8KWT5_MARES|nr:succinate dehydrogenase, hydrophobic membrane anchor protein [Mariprofundus aestuarium]ATX79380.1 succinate dehydrogenase subunit D [Mariprofundus aestuarium]